MKHQPEIKLFSTVKMAGDGAPSKQWGESLLAQADQEIELRVRTPFATFELLEQYAQDVARASDRVLLAVRQADWHKPYVRGDSPHPFLSRKWENWIDKQEQRRRQHPRVSITDQEFDSAIEAAKDRAFLIRYKRPRTNPPLDCLELLDEWVTVERVLWVARELAGVSEVTFLPRGSVHPITATFTTHETMEAIGRGIDLLTEGKKPLAAVQEIIFGAKSAASDAMSAHNTKRIALYRVQWEQFCSRKGYYAFEPVRPCVCRPKPRNLSEYIEQRVQEMRAPEPHHPECYQRTVNVLTYWSDWSLAESHVADAVGKRHSSISYYSRLFKLQREAVEENVGE